MRIKQISRGFLKGLQVTGIHLFRRPVTHPYPEQRAYTPPRFRGIHRLIVEDCVVCRACERVCPVNCLTISGVRGDNRRFILEQFDIDYSLCMFCDLCVEACPPHCLVMGPEFEIAAENRHSLRRSLLSQPKEEMV
ncbi:MAG: NADH-quinone oxidoreductase subunit I [Sulfobacillus thermosulfidooxidans]|uniref:NADH-quinone oxidoreductase subunit I n=1 Tax=Sulfobacillus thermotolerans TaxID=338644 RepID=A0ABN5GXA4_9FIRM|nr:NADH-quinone oxidoreductase subunit I [Sulfobacillus sp. hq2]AUW93135.1 NAD(P)H-quinone oxidoreductase [Sulfobacillus thermotolerans]POB10064.1 NAD(P)H-quinone oxidoreductase [Sulfobacillus sp. hq2]PSR36741.1 MAG: NADH-quinone oxidoreductase subunit I [Sulfobacillus thermosulfidooxidans]